MVLTCKGGYDTKYLTAEVAEGLAASAYYTGAAASGEPPGRWWGRGAEGLRVSGQVDTELFSAVFDHRLDPRDPAAREMATWGEAATLGARPRRSEAEALSAAYRELLAENPSASEAERKEFRDAAAQQVADTRCSQSEPVRAAYQALLDAHPGAGPERRAQLRVEADQQVARSRSVRFDDVHFAPPKSVTVLWVACARSAEEHRAAGEAAQERMWRSRAETIEASVVAGHSAALQYLEDNFCYVRTGHHGKTGESSGAWQKGRGLVAAQFLQHDSRAGDPQLHVHGPVLNSVEGPDGVWRGLDRKTFKAGLHGADAMGVRTMEAEIERKLGVRFETRPDGKAREIVGIDQESIDLFSQRRQALTPEAERLIGEFIDREGREPTGAERKALRQEASLSTRSAKSKQHRTHEEQLAGWAQRHQATVGRTLRQAADAAFAGGAGPATTWRPDDVIGQAVAAVQEKNASWTRPMLLSALVDALPGGLGVDAAQTRALLEQLADRALDTSVRLTPAEPDTADLPPQLRRADGSSIYSSPAPVRYATSDSLLGSIALREAAIERGAATVAAGHVEALLAQYAEAGRPLSGDQEAALRGICSSGARLEVLSAPAGTGKSFLDGVLVRAWEDSGTGRVRGITFGQRQADVLTEEGVTSRNITAWQRGQARLSDGRGREGDEDFRMRPGDLLIVDETQMASTDQLADIVERAHTAGAKVLFTGDPAQGGLGQSGTLADLAGRAVTRELFEVRRFTAEWERDASLRLRDGDTSVLAEYDRRGRIIDGGAREQAEQLAARAWLADTLQGRESLLITTTNKEADRICGELRAELVRLGRVEEHGVELGLQGTVAGVGDLVQARRNSREAGLVNRTVFRVLEARPDGSLLAAQVRYDRADGEQLDKARVIPKGYVAEHLSLAYASTEAAAIGRTVDTGHALWARNTGAAAGYVELTRGRDGNWAYVITQETPEGAVTGDTAQTTRREPVAVMTDTLTRTPDVTALTALAQREHAEQAARELPALLHPLTETLSGLADARTAQLLDRLTARGVITDADRAAFATDPATGSLTALLRRAELAGHDPDQLLDTAVGARGLDDARSVAQVTHDRITKAIGGRVESPTVTAFRDLIPADVPTGYRAPLERWAEAADARRTELGAELAALPEAERPAWLASLGPMPDHPLGRADWETRAGWAASWREMEAAAEPLAESDPVGAAPGAGLVDRRAVWRTAHDALRLGDDGPAEGEMSEAQLRARIRAYEREEVWAPRHVADELAGTEQALRRAEEDATMWRAHADVEVDPRERERLLTAARQADATAEQARARLPELYEVDRVRADWYAHTAATREAAERAATELETRGTDRAAEPRVTAAEWLAAHETDQAEREANAEVGEADVDERPTDATLALDTEQTADTGDEARHTTAVPDIRDTAQLDPNERADERPARRMPRADETTAALARARDAAREIDERLGRDATHDEQETEQQGHPAGPQQREADEERAEQLNAWDFDQVDDYVTTGAGSSAAEDDSADGDW